MKHELKTHPVPFRQTLSGNKKFEYRINDRNFKVYDTVILKEYDPRINEYSGRCIPCRITSITHGPNFNIPNEYVVFSIEPYESKFYPAKK